MTPAFYMTDVRSIVRHVKETFPRSVGGLRLPTFHHHDFIDMRRFCRTIQRQKGNPRMSPGTRVWQLLGDDCRRLIVDVASSNRIPTVAEEIELAEELEKRIIQNRAFYQPTMSEGIDLHFQPILDAAPAALAITEEQVFRQKQADKLRAVVAKRATLATSTLNRLLLAISFPRSIPAGPRPQSMTPIILWRKIDDDPRISLRTLYVPEGFLVYLKAAILSSMVLGSPWVLFQLWCFLAAGLYSHEKRHVYIFFPLSVVLFLGGVALCFFVVFQYVLDFLLMFNKWMHLSPDMRISEWFGFAMLLPLGFGIAFQLPLVMVFLERVGIMTTTAYVHKWRMAILVICFVAMLLTPIDPTSMLCMAIPLVALYFGGIALCWLLPRTRNPFGDHLTR